MALRRSKKTLSPLAFTLNVLADDEDFWRMKDEIDSTSDHRTITVEWLNCEIRAKATVWKRWMELAELNRK